MGSFSARPVAPGTAGPGFVFACVVHCTDCRPGNLMLLRKIILSFCVAAICDRCWPMRGNFIFLFESYLSIYDYVIPDMSDIFAGRLCFLCL